MSSQQLIEIEQKIRFWEIRRMDLIDAIDHVDSALRKIEEIDLPTAEMIGRAFQSTLQDAHRHTVEALDRHQTEAARLWSEGQNAR